LIWGNLMGFFWPVGAMFWLMREEGVWSGGRTNSCAGWIRDESDFWPVQDVGMSAVIASVREGEG